MPVNPRNFLINTDYPIDQVVYLRSGLESIGASSSGTIIIAHGLSFIPLLGGSWSLNSDFSVQYEYYSGTFPSGSVSTNLYGVELDITANSTNIIIGYENTLAATTVYFRIFGLQPSDSNVDIEPTASSADNFVVDTNLNYTKIYEAETIVVASGNTYTITHGLGYRPQVTAWKTDTSGFRSPIDFQEPSALSFDSVEVTTTTVVFTIPAFSLSNRIDYRIYYEESA